MEQNNTTVPVKLSLSGSKKRVRLHVPLKFSQLCNQVKVSFPDINEFNLQYVDDEGDNITVTSDEDLAEAQIVFKDLGRVILLTVHTPPAVHNSTRVPSTHTAPKSPVPAAVPAPKSCPKSCNAYRGCRRLRQTGTFSKSRKCPAEAMRSRWFGVTSGCAGMNPYANTGPSLNEGDVVELHSLSTKKFNGRLGRCGGFDPQTGRHQVALFATKTAPAQTIAVLSKNISLVDANSTAKIAEALGCTGGGVCSDHVTAKIAEALGCTGHMRPHPLQKLASLLRPRQSKQTTQVYIPVSILHKVSTRVPVPTQKATPVPVPTQKATPVPINEAKPVPSKVQQLLDMGFSLPVETLTNVLAAANDDVAAAITALVGRG